MKSTLYTNCMLTVIAISVLYLCVARIAQPPSAHAQSAQYSVPILKNGSNEGGTEYVPVVVFEAKWKDGTWHISEKP
jgi:hypothetical protein